MKRLLRIGMVFLGAAVLLFAASRIIRAQGKWPGSSGPKASVAPQTTTDPRPMILFSTYVTQAYYAFEGPYETGDETVPVDSPTTIKCPDPRGCTLEIEPSIDVGGVDSEGNWWGPFISVDGGPFLPYAPPVGETPTDDSYILNTSKQSTTVTCGPHTVQTYVYSFYGLYIWSYYNTYRVYVH